MKTTVLGTAFGVKGVPGSRGIKVAVVRGRVKVEDNRTLLGVLSVNQMVTYDGKTAAIENIPAQVADSLAVGWASKELDFNHEELLSVVKILSRRYGVKLLIENKKSAGKQVVATFSGTESIHDIVDMLNKIVPGSNVKIDTAR